jgi:hypothetical protein
VRQFAAKYGPQGAQVIGVEDSGAGADKVQLFKDSLSVEYPLFFDTSRQIARTFNIQATSTTFILSSDFVVRDKVELGTSQAYLEEMWAKYGQAQP